MPTKNRHLALVLLPVLALAGCAGEDMGLKSAGNFGEANRQTFAAQVIDPAPEYDTPQAAGDGQHTAKAIDRYNADQVKKPDRTSTSALSTGGGGS